MGRESASYWLAFPAGAEDALVATLSAAGAELLCFDDSRLDFCLRDPVRYWIDVRIHRVPESRLEIRIALTNDAWSIREPLQRALTPLPEALEGQPLLDDEDNEIAWPVPYWHTDAGCSLMLILLAAVNEGLGAGLFGSHRLEGLKELLGIPDDVAPIGIVTIGHAASTATTGSAKRGRKAPEHVVHRERWD